MSIEKLPSGATLERLSDHGNDRYAYDWGTCSHANGFAQIDTRQDASYYGTWANPFKLILVNYCEGDVTITRCANDAQFMTELFLCYQWNRNAGYWKGIDGMCDEKMIARFNAVGLGHLLH